MLERLQTLLLADSPAAYRRVLVILLVAVSLLLAALATIGCSPQVVWVTDSAFLLDGGWRVYQGQRPHADFYSPLGPVPLLLTATGMWVLGPDDRALYVGYVLLLLPATAWAWGIASRRLPAALAGAFALTMGLLLVAPRALGDPAWASSYAMQYNRLGWVLLSMWVLPLVLERRPALTPTGDTIEGIGSGIVLALMGFTKVNYGLIGIACLVLGGLLGRVSRRGWLGMTIGALTTVLALLAFLRFDVAAVVADLRMLSGVQQPLDRVWAVISVMRNSLAELGLFAMVLVLLARPTDQGRGKWLEVTVAVLLVLFGLAVCSTNAQQLEMPLVGVAALYLCERRRRAALADTPEGGRRFLAGAGVALVLLGVVAAPDAASVLHSLKWRFFYPKGALFVQPIEAERLRHLGLPLTGAEPHNRADVIRAILAREDEFLTSYQYGYWVNDGLALVRRHARGADCVHVLDWVNPFSFALELSSPRGSALFWDVGRVVNDAHCPPAERVFADVTLVLEPKRPILQKTADFMQRVYGNTLEEQFDKIDESELWVLYARRPTGRRPVGTHDAREGRALTPGSGSCRPTGPPRA